VGTKVFPSGRPGFQPLSFSRVVHFWVPDTKRKKENGTTVSLKTREDRGAADQVIAKKKRKKLKQARNWARTWGPQKKRGNPPLTAGRPGTGGRVCSIPS